MTPADRLAHRTSRLATELRGAQRAAVNRGALVLKRSIERSRDQVVRQGLRNVGRGARLGVGFDVRGTANPVALVKARGPWQIIDGTSRTKAHEIAPRRRRGRRGNGLVLPDGGVRRSVQHPGSRRYPLWRRGVEQGTAPAVNAMRDEFVQAARRGFSG